jgi:hypothetical protein
MAKRNPIVSQRFGRLVVLEERQVKLSDGRYKYPCLCRCDCGQLTEAEKSNLATGTTSSCGCFRLERLREATVTHGQSDSVVYQIWCNMIQRCTNPSNGGYDNYGGRGITVTCRWKTFAHFYADMGDPPIGMTLERLDVDGSYSPSNCCWASQLAQARNKRANRVFTYQGKTQCLSQWAEDYGVKYWTYHARLRRGWSIEEILETPVRQS